MPRWCILTNGLIDFPRASPAQDHQYGETAEIHRGQNHHWSLHLATARWPALRGFASEVFMTYWYILEHTKLDRKSTKWQMSYPDWFQIDVYSTLFHMCVPIWNPDWFHPSISTFKVISYQIDSPRSISSRGCSSSVRQKLLKYRWASTSRLTSRLRSRCREG